MLATLSLVEPRLRTGLLSRVALYLSSNGQNPNARPILAGEEELRTKLITEAESVVKEAQRDVSEGEFKELVSDLLDAEADAWSEPSAIKEALDRLTNDAALPGDAYDLRIHQVVYDKAKTLPRTDFDLVAVTIRSPDQEEQFRLNEQVGIRPRMVSLFAKWFNFRDENDEFLFIVLGRRKENRIFLISEYFRVYSADVNLSKAEKISDALERFAGIYGASFSVLGWRGKFLRFISTQFKENMDLKLEIVEPINEMHTLSILLGKYDNLLEASFGICLNVNSYKRGLNRHMKGEAVKLPEGINLELGAPYSNTDSPFGVQSGEISNGDVYIRTILA